MRLAATSAVIGSVVSILATATPAAAVCLLNEYSVGAEFNRSRIVMVGKVEGARTITDADGLVSGTFYRLRTTRIFKGSPRRSLPLYSENASGRFPMDLGRAYLLFVYSGVFNDDIHSLAVDNCGNSARLGPDASKALMAVRKLARRR